MRSPLYCPEWSSCKRVFITSMGCSMHASTTPPMEPATAFTVGLTCQVAARGAGQAGKGRLSDACKSQRQCRQTDQIVEGEGGVREPVKKADCTTVWAAAGAIEPGAHGVAAHPPSQFGLAGPRPRMCLLCPTLLLILLHPGPATDKRVTGRTGELWKRGQGLAGVWD